jgi:hypothetical protein
MKSVERVGLAAFVAIGVWFSDYHNVIRAPAKMSEFSSDTSPYCLPGESIDEIHLRKIASLDPREQGIEWITLGSKLLDDGRYLPQSSFKVNSLRGSNFVRYLKHRQAIPGEELCIVAPVALGIPLTKPKMIDPE